MGFPTINQHLPQDILTPARGVYATRIFLPEELGGDTSGHMAVTNIGTRPTLENQGDTIVESFLLDFDGDLYGKEARVEFHHFLRPEQKFQNVMVLQAQIQRDIGAVRAYFNTPSGAKK